MTARTSKSCARPGYRAVAGPWRFPSSGRATGWRSGPLAAQISLTPRPCRVAPVVDRCANPAVYLLERTVAVSRSIAVVLLAIAALLVSAAPGAAAGRGGPGFRGAPGFHGHPGFVRP